MKKNFLFGTLAVLLAGFWFGGASLAACTDTDVACLNDTGYPSLKAAIEASADNDVITLLDNDEVSFDGSNLMLTIDKGVTIEGNGKYIKGVSNGYDSWHVTLIKGDKNITIKDLTFKNFGDTLGFDTNGTTTPIYVHRTYGGKLTLENVNIESYNSRGIVIGNGSFEINGGKIKGSSDQAYQQAIESYVSTNSSISGLEITGVKDLVNGDDITDAYGIMHAGNGTVTVTNTKIGGSRGVAVSSPTSAWASALSYDKSNGKLILGEGNEFEGSTNVIAIVPMGDPVEQSSSSTIEVSDGKYVGAIDKSTDTSVTEANIEISGGKFSVDPSAYVVAGKVAKSISEAPYAFEVANPDPTPSYSGGGGGGGSSKASTKNDTKATDTDKKADETKAEETKNDEKVAEEAKDQQPSEEKVPPMTDAQAVAKFGQEQIDAYKWALENGITTMKTVEEARLDQPLTRAELAKMMVVYIAKIIEKQPVLTGDVNYQDVKAEELGDLAGYIQLAYQYQIMGINADGTPIDFFNPNGIVSRGEYATVFSRVLFGSLFNKEGEDFYTNHLKALEAAGILSNTEPTIQEMRGWVMLMMYRSTQNADKIAAVIEALGATEEEVADAQAKAEEEGVNEENAENTEATTGDVVEAPEAETTTGDVAEAPEAKASTGAVAE